MNKATQDKVDKLIGALCDTATAEAQEKRIDAEVINAISRLVDVSSSPPQHTPDPKPIGFHAESGGESE